MLGFDVASRGSLCGWEGQEGESVGGWLRGWQGRIVLVLYREVVVWPGCGEGPRELGKLEHGYGAVHWKGHWDVDGDWDVDGHVHMDRHWHWHLDLDGHRHLDWHGHGAVHYLDGLLKWLETNCS